ncbi:MAG: hypothetical protein LUD40_08025 [Phocaeicola dorei]|nr:hypothetical protein [Phocaeicola dorei]
MIAIAEFLWAMFSSDTKFIKGFPAHTIRCAIVKSNSHGATDAFLNIFYFHTIN